MAPEMVVMLSQTSAEKVGYTNTVDWWSLGVTTFKLLTGFRPFTEENFNAFMEMASTKNGRYQYQDAPPEYAMLFQDIPFPNYVSPDMKDFISKLLDVNEKTRLGSGKDGVNNIKNHRVFAGMDWDLLEQKHVEPPFKPDQKLVDEVPLHANFETLMKDLDKESWLTDVLHSGDQKYFDNW
jgi:serine/threonine protein kinase